MDGPSPLEFASLQIGFDKYRNGSRASRRSLPSVTTQTGSDDAFFAGWPGGGASSVVDLKNAANELNDVAALGKCAWSGNEIATPVLVGAGRAGVTHSVGAEIAARLDGGRGSTKCPSAFSLTFSMMTFGGSFTGPPVT